MEQNENDIILAYRKEDFFWSSADSNDLNDASCLIQDCDKSNLNNNNIKSCYSKALCLNKTYYDNLKEIQNTHSSSNGRYKDITNVYTRTILETFNLIIGILFMTTLLLYQKSL
jgi:hypothetical protein